MKKKIVIIVQARTGSSRLPGKILLPVQGATMLQHQLQRIKMSKFSDKVVVATTKHIEDNIVERICVSQHFHCYRGSENDLLDRHYRVAKEYKPDAVVKIPADCPLVDPAIIDKVIGYYLENDNKYDFVSNLHPATYPDGNDVEIMSFDAIERAWEEATLNHEREHTTPYIWDNPDMFRIGNVVWESGLNYSMSHRFTLDYEEDYNFISEIYDRLYPIKQDFSLGDILDLLHREPGLLRINDKYNGVNWYRHHLNSLKTVTIDDTRIVAEESW